MHLPHTPYACVYIYRDLLACCPRLKAWTCSWAAHKAGHLTVELTGSVVNSKYCQNQTSGAMQASRSAEMPLRIPGQKSRCIKLFSLTNVASRMQLYDWSFASGTFCETTAPIIHLSPLNAGRTQVIIHAIEGH